MFVIAGVTGHVGSVVAKQLLGKKQKVKVVVRDAAKGAEWSKAGAEIAVGVLDDKAFLTGALKGATGFFALLPPDVAAADVFGSQKKLADAMAGAVKAGGVPLVVMLSSIGADLPSGTGPIAGLHYLENALRATNTKLVAVRAGSFQENVANSMGAVRQGLYPSFMNADYPVPMIATRDIGALAAESLLAPPSKNETIDLVGPSYSARQVAEKLGAALGKALTVVDVPQPGWLPALMQAGLPKTFAEAMVEMYGAFSSGKVSPKGDRLVQGKTEIDELITRLTK